MHTNSLFALESTLVGKYSKINWQDLKEVCTWLCMTAQPEGALGEESLPWGVFAIALQKGSDCSYIIGAEGIVRKLADWLEII